MLLGAACAGDLALEGHGAERRYRHREHGYRIAPPPALAGLEWQRHELEGADLAFRARDDERVHLSLLSRCRGTRAGAEVLARALTAGVDRERFETRQALVVLGRPGWTQTFDAEAGTRVRTVTVVAERCVFDWLVVAPAPRFDAAATCFDAWWPTFELPEAGP